jgi:hypothetical protein
VGSAVFREVIAPGGAGPADAHALVLSGRSEHVDAHPSQGQGQNSAERDELPGLVNQSHTRRPTPDRAGAIPLTNNVTNMAA